MYEYTAKVVGVYDGDSITVDINLGFKSKMECMKLRLYGINTPEVRGPERPDGLVSKSWLEKQILGKEVRLKTYRDKVGKYGRWLADIYPIDGDENTPSYNAQLVELGLAEWRQY